MNLVTTDRFFLCLPLLMLGCAEPHHSKVWSGWNYTWERLSHRVSLLKAVMEEDGTGSMGLVGGDWSTGSSAASDSGQYRLRYQEVLSQDLAVLHGETALTVGPEPTYLHTEQIDVSALNEFDHHLVLLRGFSINTDTDQNADYPIYDESTDTGYSPALGYCSKGFGFMLGDVNVDSDVATFDVEARIRWGPNGKDDPIDRTDMNEAIPFAMTETVVAWTLVGFNGSEERISLEGSVDYEHGAYSDQPPLTGEDLGLAVDGDNPSGISGIVGFDLMVDVTTDPEQGEYLRSYGVELLNPGSGDGPLDVWTEATNSSLIETAAIRFSPTLELVSIELDGEAEVTNHLLEGTHDVGFVQVDQSGLVD